MWAPSDEILFLKVHAFSLRARFGLWVDARLQLSLPPALLLFIPFLLTPGPSVANAAVPSSLCRAVYSHLGTSALEHLPSLLLPQSQGCLTCSSVHGLPGATQHPGYLCTAEHDSSGCGAREQAECGAAAESRLLAGPLPFGQALKALGPHYLGYSQALARAEEPDSSHCSSLARASLLSQPRKKNTLLVHQTSWLCFLNALA